MEKSKEKTNEGKSWKILAAVSVRASLILHSILATWRVRIAYDDGWMWCLIFGNIPLLLEGWMVVKFNGGNEWKWWCPCFLLYLGSTLPSIWLLQLSQNDKLQATTQTSMILPIPQYLFGEDSSNFTDAANFTGTTNSSDIGNFTENTTLSMLTSTIPTTSDPGLLVTIEEFLDLEDTTWIVVMQEALMYLIVFGRWILPRAEVSRVALSDLLLLYLAMASDIMELYAVFDEQVVQENREVTFAILTIWSVSFLQFVPVLAQKNKYRQSVHFKRLTRACGRHFTEVVTTLSSIILQDGPFFCLRLYIMIDFQLITYSLVFFVLKNFVSVLLLIYRLVILCLRLPCCYDDGVKDEEFSQSEFVSPERYSDTFITTNGRYYPAQPRLVNHQHHHQPQALRLPVSLPQASRQHTSPPLASRPHASLPHASRLQASPASQASPSSQVFVITAGKQKYIAKQGVVYRNQLKTEKKPRLGSL